MADLRFSITVRDRELEACKLEHDRRVSRLYDYLRSKKYPPNQLSLESTILRPQSAGGHKLAEDFYLAKTIFSLSSRRLAELSTLQADIVELGVDEVEIVTLRSSRQAAHEAQARIRALSDAIRVAELTADELKWELAHPVRMAYLPTDRSRQLRAQSATAGAAVRLAAGAGTTHYVDCRVEVTFQYVSTEKMPRPRAPPRPGDDW
jgi:uncharacterized protein YggE